jgi:hypothetical protein
MWAEIAAQAAAAPSRLVDAQAAAAPTGRRAMPRKQPGGIIPVTMRWT